MGFELFADLHLFSGKICLVNANEVCKIVLFFLCVDLSLTRFESGWSKQTKFAKLVCYFCCFDSPWIGVRQLVKVEFWFGQSKLSLQNWFATFVVLTHHR